MEKVVGRLGKMRYIRLSHSLTELIEFEMRRGEERRAAINECSPVRYHINMGK